MAEVNPEISLQSGLISESVKSALVRERLMAALSGAFGALAGLLAAIGLYGVMSYNMTRRSNEMGIRLAMGAVLRMVLVDAGQLVTVGLVAGVALGLVASYFPALRASRLDPMKVLRDE